MLYTVRPSPLGDLLLAGPRPGVLRWLCLEGQKYAAEVEPEWRRDAAAFSGVADQLDSYLAGELTEFDVELDVQGSLFRRAVWDAIDRIPYGTTVTYGGLAASAGQPPASVRAVGGAVGRNPVSIIRPCHRVIGSNGALTGFAGGLERKSRLLTLEGVRC